MQLISDELYIKKSYPPRSVVKLYPRGMKKNAYTYLSLLLKQKQSSNIHPLTIKELNNWIINHDNVNESSCSKNSFKIKPDGGDKNISVTKLYLQVNIKGLFDDTI